MTLLANLQGVQGLQGGIILKARIVAILLFIGLAIFLSGCDGSDSTSGEAIIPLEEFNPSFIDTANWMSKLKDDRNLNQIVFPGSHDAGMSVCDRCTSPEWVTRPMTKTQKWNIAQQLIAGSRYFDIRLCSNPKDGKHLRTYHRNSKGWGCDGEFFNNFFKQTGEFLMAHPNEFVIFKFSHFYNFPKEDYYDYQAIWDCMYWIYEWNEYFKSPVNGGREIIFRKDVSIFHNLITTEHVSDVRGKIVCLFDINTSYISQIIPAYGRFWYWDKGDGGTWWQTNLPVYDEYSDTNNFLIMANDQLEKFKKHGGFNQFFLFLLSWTCTPQGINNIEYMAYLANKALPGMLNGSIMTLGKLPNIVFIDFVDIGINQEIIKYNDDVRTR